MIRPTGIIAVIVTALLFTLIASCTSRDINNHYSLAPDVQAQLDALQTPQGVDPMFFAQLKDAFAQAMQGQGKSASVPPTGVENTPANVHFTDNGGGNFTLDWDYRNIGDYNQDGEVNVADITPLAIHFGHDPGTDGLDIVLHPSGVGKVGVGDITPLAQHFGTFCTGYRIWSDVSETGMFSTLVGQMYVNEATGGTDGWKHFAYTFSPDPQLWYRVQSWDEHGGNPGQPCMPLQISAGGNPPVINSVSPLAGGANDDVTFTANVTNAVTDWSWDFGGGATPDTSTVASPAVKLAGKGDYNASVTATNPFGSDTFNFTLSVADKWYVHQILAGASLGRAVSAASIGGDGKQCVAFSNDADGSIMYARSTAVWYPTTSSDWVYMTADSSNVYDGNLSLSVENGTWVPAILAHTGSKAELIASSTDEPASSADWAATDITTSLTADTGSLALLQGTLTASLHYDGALVNYEAITEFPAGPTDWTPLIVDASAVVNLGADAVTVQNPLNSNIYTLYRDTTSDRLLLAWVDFYDRFTPSAWTKMEIASGGAPGVWSGLAFDRVGSMLAIYSQSSPNDLIWESYGNDAPTSPADLVASSIIDISSANFSVKPGMSTGFINGQRWIVSYYDPFTYALSFSYSQFVPAAIPTIWNFETIDQPTAPDAITGGNAMIVNSGAFVVVFYGRSDGLYCAVLPLS
jgi:PKD repeat protein